MGKSFRHNDFASITCSGFNRGEKKDKKRANKKLRRKTRMILDDIDDDAMMPEIKEISNIWDWAKDGKMDFSDYNDPDSECYNPQLYRRFKNK